MDWLLLAASLGLPIFKIVLFPARAVTRGGSWTMVGALMIVGLAMALWFGVRSMEPQNSGTAKAATATTSAASSSQPQLRDIAKLP